VKQDWSHRRRSDRSQPTGSLWVPELGGDISTLDHPRSRSAIHPAQLLAIVALVAALLGLSVFLATSVITSTSSTAGHSAHAQAATAPSGSNTFSESPSFTLPFPPNPADRPARAGEVPSLYADGLPCSTGCLPYEAETGWPVRPFHRQHAIRAGLNELRPESLHVAVDIQARDGARVYAVQPGVAQVLAPSGPDGRIQVGNYIYWHINPKVTTGELVTPFKTVLGTVMSGYGHMAFSEVGSDGQYANPLRPEGTVLKPYADHARPVIGSPSVSRDGQVVAPAYDPQTFIRKTKYYTPVLAPAAVAYRLYNSHGDPVTPLEWSFRGTHLLQFAERSLIYAPGARDPGYNCFATRTVCIPRWIYRVADGLAPPLPATLDPGRYRLTIYAWDWANNKTALDTTVTMTANGWRPIGHIPSSLFTLPGYYQRDLLLPKPTARQPLPRFYQPPPQEAPSGVLPRAPVGPPAPSRHVTSPTTGEPRSTQTGQPTPSQTGQPTPSPTGGATPSPTGQPTPSPTSQPEPAPTGPPRGQPPR
jgi:hypothetical protein